jgi:hypothetical protein
MKKEYKNINRYFRVVSRALFRTDSSLSYNRTLEAISKLAEVVHSTETEEDVWYIGADEGASLDQVLAGACWFCADYYGGQNSSEYKLLSILGKVYNPGCENGPKEESSEQDVYDALERMYNEYKG